MADTQNITVTDTWAQLPAATEFLLQNTAERRVMWLVIAATTPAAGINGYMMSTGDSTKRLGPGIHWARVRTAVSITVPFTVTEA